MRRSRSILALAVLAFLMHAVAAQAAKTTRETITWQGKERTYYLFVPDSVKPRALSATPATPAKVPLLLAFHGSGRDGKSIVVTWEKVAKKEGFVVVGPDAVNSNVWQPGVDGPEFLRELIGALSTKLPIDPRRVYLFGHSGGAVFVLGLAMLESEYFAAMALHAGSWRDTQNYAMTQYAKRKIPLALFSGDRDELFPIASVRATRDVLAERGFPVELTEIPNHDHWYYDIAARINRQAWEFLAKHALAGEPRFEVHRYSR